MVDISSGHVVIRGEHSTCLVTLDKVQRAGAKNECPPDHAMEDDPALSTHHGVTWFKAQTPVSYPSSRVLRTVNRQGQNLRK